MSGVKCKASSYWDNRLEEKHFQIGQTHSREFLRPETVQIIHHNQRLQRRLEEKHFQIGVVGDFGHVDVVPVVAQEPRHDGDEAGFFSAGGVVEQKAPLPNAEIFEIGPDFILQLSVHHHGVEGGGVRGRNRSPPFIFAGEVHVELDLSVPLLDFVGDGEDVLEVLAEHTALVGPVDFQDEGADFV
ncbi:hypothetical protein COP1_036345 [Malus domestica]